MEVVNPLVNHLSAFEVLQLLAERKRYYDIALSELESSSTKAVYPADRDHVAPPNVSTILLEGLRYLRAPYNATARMTEDGMTRLLEGLEPYCARSGRENGLTKAERLQICDSAPTQAVEFYLIIEECDLRFTETEVEEIISLVSSTLSECPIGDDDGVEGSHVNGVKEEDELMEEPTTNGIIVSREEEDDADDALVQEGLEGEGVEDRELDEVPD